MSAFARQIADLETRIAVLEAERDEARNHLRVARKECANEISGLIAERDDAARAQAFAECEKIAREKHDLYAQYSSDELYCKGMVNMAARIIASIHTRAARSRAPGCGEK